VELIIVTGMSGAGKSQAVDALEDMGFYCVDNVPPSLLSKFAELPAESHGSISRIALVVDARSQGMFSDLAAKLEELRSERNLLKILFLDCDDKVLQTRYKETRRRHPLVTEEAPSLREAVARERGLVEPIRQTADYVIETSMLSTGQLKSRVRELFADARNHTMMITCMSFGFKYGLPVDSDLVFDVRCLPNPFYVDELKHRVGTEKPVRDYVLAFDAAKGLSAKILELLDYLIPLYIQEGKSQLVVSMGCTGGKHRSVVFAELLAEHLRQQGVAAGTSHRDIAR
jgi:UPF0042 nucleotide-binding protein